jgi:PKD repeat protein
LASWPYANDSSDAQTVFQQSERTTPPNPGDTLDFNFQTVDPGVSTQNGAPNFVYWLLTYGQTPPMVIQTDQGGVPNATWGTGPNGQRYLQQIGPGSLWTQRTGLGLDFLSGNHFQQLSDYFGSVRYANRLSFILQAPDQAYLPDGSIADITQSPVAYLNAVAYETADYDEADGYGWLDNSQETDNWHYYWGPGGGWVPSQFWAQTPYHMKIESLGNHFQRITLSNMPGGERSSATHTAPATADPIRPDLTAFAGDHGAMMRNETGLYLDIQGAAHFVNQDPQNTSSDVFMKGLTMWRMYGFSEWYEDDGVDVLGTTTEYPQGSPFIQALIATTDPQFLNIPFTIHNHSSQASSYSVYSPCQSNSYCSTSGVTLYSDPNNTGAPDPNNSLGTQFPIQNGPIAAGGTLHFIMQIDTTLLQLEAPDERSVEVHVIDPNDPLTLKHANLMVETYRTANPAGMCNDNIFYFHASGSPGMSCPSNPIPVASFTANGTPVTSGMSMTVMAGTPISFTTTGTKPGPANGLTQLASRFYFPDGTSAVTLNGPTVQWTPFIVGSNQMVLMQIGDGRARDFAMVNLNVIRGAHANPVAKINVPSASDHYIAGQPAFFGAFADPADNYSPSGGGPSTHYGIAQFNWDFGDGQTATNNEFPQHIYANPGTYTVTLTDVDDTGGSTSVTAQVVIGSPYPPPVANITAINPGGSSLAGSSTQLTPGNYMQYGVVELTGANSTPGDIAQYVWSFTGPNGYTDNTNLTYRDDAPLYGFTAWYPGTYQVNLTVFDQGGVSSSTSTTINVLPWDGVYRVDPVFTQSIGAGDQVFHWDVSNMQVGWTPISSSENPLVYGAQRVGPGTNGQFVTIDIYTLNISSGTLPSGTPTNLSAMFADAIKPLMPASIP